MPPRPSAARFLLVAALLALLAPFAMGHAQPAGSRPQVMIVGTMHLDNPGRDLNNVKVDDVLAPARQKELDALVGYLAAFRPTKILIEVPVARDSAWNARYRDYLAGRYELTRDERDQIALRLAKRLGHSRVYAADFKQDLPFGEMFQWAKANGQQAFADEMAAMGRRIVQEFQSELATTSMTEVIRVANSPRSDSTHAVYLQAMRIGADSAYPGADMTAAWYARNLKILTNVMRISEPGDRLLVLFGAGHGPLLREFAAQSRLFDVVPVERVLPREKVARAN